MHTIIANSCNWRCSIKAEPATMCLGLLSHCSGCISKTSVSLSGIIMSQAENEASLT